MLSDVMKEDFVQFDVEAEDFLDAVKKALQPFLTAEIVTESYVDSILQVYQTSGPYIVITKNIALPHAPIEAGALKLGIGFTRLKYPVISGNKANDPVLYLFPLSASDNQSHLRLLAELADLFSTPEFLQVIESVSNKKEFLNYIRQKEGEKEHEKA